MSLFETSEDIGVTPATTTTYDRWHQQARPATGTQTSVTTRQGPEARPYIATRDGIIRGNDGSRDEFFIGFQPGGFPTGNIGMKIAVPGGDAVNDPLDQLLFYWDFSTGTQYWNDPVSGKNYMQNGYLPDGTGGITIAKPGVNVDDLFS